MRWPQTPSTPDLSRLSLASRVNFKLASNKKFMSTIVACMDLNSEIFKRVLDDDEFSDFLKRMYLERVYEELRKGS